MSRGLGDVYKRQPWKLLELFLKAFTSRDNVVLLLKTSSEGPKDETDKWSRPTDKMVEDWVLKFPDPPGVRIINDTVSQNSINAIHRIGDCFLSFTRGEGWGLGLFEAAGLGNPVLCTGWGGQTEFLAGIPGSLIDYTLVPVVCSEMRETHTRGHRWAQVDDAKAISAMRHVFENPRQSKQQALVYSQVLKHQYSVESITRRILEVVR